MPEEFHISSLIVHGLQERLPAISATIAVLPGAEVHASDGSGKLVVTLESVSEADISKRIDEIRALEGVFAASLVYHEVEDTEAEEAESVS